MIPFFGPFFGAIPSVILLFFESPKQALVFAIFVLVLQQFDGNILGPKILGDSIGLPAFWVMFAILVGGGLFGFVGMLVGVPCFAVIYELSKEGINNVLKKKKLPTAVKLYQGSDKIETLTEPETEEETESVSEEAKEETTEEKSEENPIETEKTKEEKTEE
ncbi:MAG: AI-2E family transporter, partial [Oscillospiraceae bacterium]|nr:AI-2E family transporter [Oscillospiraceae bacterium]